MKSTDTLSQALDSSTDEDAWLTSPDSDQPLPAWETDLPTVELSATHRDLLARIGDLRCRAAGGNRQAGRTARALEQQVQRHPYVARALGSRRARRPGRPNGRGSLDTAFACRIAVAVDVLGFRPIEVLQALGRVPDISSNADYKWLNRHLEEGCRHPTLAPAEPQVMLRRKGLATLPSTARNEVLRGILGSHAPAAVSEL